MNLSLLDTRPFNKFVEMELERDNLYDSFTQLDEPKEISEAWVIFAESCSKNLSAINSLADMAVERIYDVYQDIQQGKDNPLALHELLYGDFPNQIMALNKFELQLGVLTYVYSQVRNRGVFNHKPITSQYSYYIVAKESIDRIVYRILSDTLPDVEISGLTPTPTKEDLLDVIMPLVQLENMKRLLPIYDNLPDSTTDPRVLSKKGEYDYLQGVTLLTHIIDISRRTSQDFWWSDPISELSILNHAKEHFETVIKLWNKAPESVGSKGMAIKMDFMPIVDAQSSASMVQHFKLLAESALEGGDLGHASRYYTRTLTEFKKAYKILKKSRSSQSEYLYKRVQAEESELKILKSITELALRYTEIVDKLYAQDKEGALESCLKITEILKHIEGAGSLPYIYGASVAYSSAASMINDLLIHETANLNVIDRLISQFNYPMKAMSAALSEVPLSDIKVDHDNPVVSFNNLQEIDKKLSYLEKAIELVPQFIQEKDEQRSKAHAMRNYIQSVISENKIYLYSDYNIVLDLILRARAHYFVKKAEQNISEIKKGETKLKKLISQRLIETKISGMITESSLISLGLQSSYKKNKRALIEEMITLVNETDTLPEFIAESVEAQFNETTDFHELLDLILLDTQELLATNENVSIKGNDINFDFVRRREIFIPAIKTMVEAVENVILGELFAKNNKMTRAEGSYNIANKLFFEISESLGKIINYLEDQKELPKFLYQLSLFCRENASSIRNRRKRQEPPYSDIIATLDYLILNL
ncbi:MAG: hypothetical protein ACTSVO_09955 [Candidatus Heimdallarchaeaceae archaeon]